MIEQDFSPYLQSLQSTYQDWWKHYVVTDSEGRAEILSLEDGQSTALLFDFSLMAKAKPQVREIDNKSNAEKSEQLPVLEGLKKYAEQHVLLVGKPGSGKSTTLVRLLLELATNFTKPEVVCRKIPVLIELRAWQTSLIDLIGSSCENHGIPLSEANVKDLLESNQFFILFDGVNELPSETARLELLRFRQDHRQMPMVFTTRNLSLGGDLKIEKQLEMQPLTKSQMKDFVRAYLPAEQADVMLGQLQYRLWSFGQAPLLLWMLCSLFKECQQIPNNLGKVFRFFTNNYPEKIKPDVVLESDKRSWPTLLQLLAVAMMQNKTKMEVQLSIPRSEVCRLFADYFDYLSVDPLAPEKALDDLLKYHLIQLNGDLVEFKHQLIQEYYAAEWLLNELPKIDNEALRYSYLNYLKWTESIALMLALVDKEDLALRVVQLSLQTDLMLGARLAGEVKADFQEKTVQLVKNLEVPKWFKIDLLGNTNSSQVLPELLNYLEDESVSANWFHWLEKLCTMQILPELKQVLDRLGAKLRPSPGGGYSDQDGLRYSNLLKVISKIDPQFASEKSRELLLENINSLSFFAFFNIGNSLGDRQSLDLLIESLHSSGMYKRVNAAKLLGQSKDLKSLDMLTVVSLTDRESSVRKSATNAILEIDLERGILNLMERLGNPDEIDRESVLQELLRRKSLLSFDGLMALFKINDDEVSWFVAIILANLGRKEALGEIDRKLSHPDYGMRYHAALALGQIRCQEAFDKLTMMLTDENFIVRTTAALGLAAGSQEIAFAELVDALEDFNLAQPGSVVEIHHLESTNEFAFHEVIDGKSQQISNEKIQLLGGYEMVKELLMESRSSMCVVSNLTRKIEILEALTNIDKPEAIVVMKKQLQSGSLVAKWASAIQLGMLGESTEVDSILHPVKLGHTFGESILNKIAKALTKLWCQEVANLLLEMLVDKNCTVRQSTLKIISQIKQGKDNMHLYPEQVMEIVLSNSCVEADIVARSIQFNCGFYRYDFHKSSTEYRANIPPPASPQTINIGSVGIFNAGNVNGDQIGIQNNNGEV
jgi:HEAT repeat protein